MPRASRSWPRPPTRPRGACCGARSGRELRGALPGVLGGDRRRPAVPALPILYQLGMIVRGEVGGLRALGLMAVFASAGWVVAAAIAAVVAASGIDFWVPRRLWWVRSTYFPIAVGNLVFTGLSI